MWWGSSTFVYLSPGLLMARTASGETVAYPASEGGLLPDMRGLDEGVPVGSRVEVHLSAEFCPAIDVDYPTDMVLLPDKQVFAQARCAQELGVSASSLHVCLDVLSPRVAAPVERSVLTHLGAWAQVRAHKLLKVRPLWSVATSSRAARRASNLSVIEHRALTVIGTNASSGALHGASIKRPAGSPSVAVERRLHHSLSLDPDRTVRLAFGVGGGSANEGRDSDLWGFREAAEA